MNAIIRIEQRLNELGIKRSKMLADLGIPSSTFSTWKKKDAAPDRKYLVALSDYLGLSTDYILIAILGVILLAEMSKTIKNYQYRCCTTCCTTSTNKKQGEPKPPPKRKFIIIQ